VYFYQWSEKMTLLNESDYLITEENVDPEFKDLIMANGSESLAICYQCGTCSGACPSGRRTPYMIRRLVRKALMGLKDDIISDDALWMCTTCYECQERCPRDIKIVEIVKAVRNVAAKEGYMAKAHKMTGVYVAKTGHAVPINDATKALRKEIGLDEVPATTHSNPDALEEVQTLIKATGFDELIGYDWASGDLKE
jgi:heterodisulfide reductase subunit C